MKKAVLFLSWLVAALPCTGETTTVSYQVSVGNDDGYAWGATDQDLTGAYLLIGDDRVYTPPFYVSAMRFTNVTVPRSAAIVSAYLSINSGAEGNRGQIYGVIEGEAVDNAADFSSRYIGAAAKTTAGLDWDHKDNWAANTWYSSGDIAAVVQQVIDRAGWSHGNAVGIFYSTRTDSGKSRLFSSFESGAPILEITYETYSISGFVKTAGGTPIDGATISPGFDVEGMVTDVSGYYELKVPPGWSGTVTVSKTDWGFNPPTRAYSGVAADQNDQDYTAFQPRISGYVRDTSGAGISEVLVSANNGAGSYVTDSDGYYEVVVTYRWSGTVTPSKNDYFFDPHHRIYINVTEDITDHDYITTDGISITNTYSTAVRYNSAYCESDWEQKTGLSYLFIGYSGSLPYTMLGMRFSEIKIPANAVITDARIHLTSYAEYSSSSNQIYGELFTEEVDNAPDFSDRRIDNIYAYETINWDHTGWWHTDWVYTSPDISELIDRVTSRSGWAWDNAIVVLYRPRIASGGSRRVCNRSYEPEKKPALEITCRYVPTIRISGRIEDEIGASVEGVAVTTDNEGGATTTDVNGYYEIWVADGWNGTITFSKGLWLIPTANYAALSEDQYNQDIVAFRPRVMSGNILTDESVASEGIIVSADNGGTSDTTDANGYYEVEVSYGWSGMVAPATAGWIFNPDFYSFVNVTNDTAGLDFISFQPLISGYINDANGSGISGVVVSTSNGATDTTDANGYYELSVAYNWSGTVTPTNVDWGFLPVNKEYSNITTDQVNQDYTAFKPKISGYIEDSSGLPFEDVTINSNNGGGTDITDTNGFYEIEVPYNWSGTVTPNKAYWAFTPERQTYNNIISDHNDQNYTAYTTNFIIDHYTDTLSLARGSLTATTVGNLAMFAGGGTGGSSGVRNIVDIYDAETGQWSTDTLSQARWNLAATTVGHKAMFAGGASGSPSNVVDIYDAETEQWSTATLSQARNNLAATTAGNKAIFAGGDTSINNPSNVVDIYDDETGQWSTATLSQARYSLSATTVGSKAIFAGGNTGSNYGTNRVDIYDDSTGLWSTATLSQTRYALAATSIGNKAFFAGGKDYEPHDGYAYTDYDIVDIYDNSTGLWSTASLSQARYILTATTSANKAFFGGGRYWDGDAYNEFSNVVDIYDPETDLWLTAALSQARAGLAATSVGNKAIFAGGAFQTSILNVIDIFEILQLGDMDSTGGVDFADFAALALAWRTEEAEINWNPDCDISHPNDGVIDELDLSVFCENWLEGTTP
ncbi:MAG: Kelch repeat-containing protein [Planctomycetota bacterium]|jgi:hypothetical protein